jgi:hypothetical protein
MKKKGFSILQIIREIIEINEIVERIMIFVICMNSEIHQIRRYSEFTQSGHNNLVRLTNRSIC